MAGNVDRVTLAIEAPAIRALSHGMREKCGGYFTIEREYSRAGAPLLSLGRVASGLMAMAGSEADADGLKPNPAVPRLHGERVLLREWIQDDLEPFEALNADARVMEHFPSPLTRSESDALVRERVVPQFAERGFGVWAVEVPEVAPFIGYVGLFVHTFEAEFTPCVEIGWRLAFPHWGNGYATEAARVAIAFGFEAKGVDEIISFTVPANRRSVAVMERLGMSYVGEFDHPKLPAGHRLRRHVLYRLSRP